MKTIVKTNLQKSANGKITNQLITVNSESGKKDLNFQDVRTYYNTLIDQNIDPHKIVVKLFGVEVLTAKSFDDGELRDFDDEDYFEGKVLNPKTYHKFYRIQFIIRK